MNNRKKIPGINTSLKVLVSVSTEDDAHYKWFAVALEMDVWGFGNTAAEAEQDLKELVATQIEFATGRGEEEMLDHPAEDKWFKLWDEVRKASNAHIKNLCKTKPLPTIKGKTKLQCCYKHAA